MRRILVSVLTGILLTEASLGQGGTASQLTIRSSNRNRAQATAATKLEDGTTIHVSLIKPVDARKNKAGDEVMAKTEWDVSSEDGVVVLPVGSMIVGHITGVSVRSREHKVSALGIVFDRAILMDGTNVSMPLAILAISRAQASDASEVEDALATRGEKRALAMRAMATPASMGGIMLRDVLARMNAAANPADATLPLTSSSQGVLGLPNLYFSAEVSGATNVSLVSSKNTNVRLNSGTEMILRLNAR